jgi:hypothetical protein
VTDHDTIDPAAANAGYDAYSAGQPYSDNPHSPARPTARGSWSHGWIIARDHDEESK